MVVVEPDIENLAVLEQNLKQVFEVLDVYVVRGVLVEDSFNGDIVPDGNSNDYGPLDHKIDEKNGSSVDLVAMMTEEWKENDDVDADGQRSIRHNHYRSTGPKFFSGDDPGTQRQKSARGHLVDAFRLRDLVGMLVERYGGDSEANPTTTRKRSPGPTTTWSSSFGRTSTS
jgi:hypothetical protein